MTYTYLLHCLTLNIDKMISDKICNLSQFYKLIIITVASRSVDIYIKVRKEYVVGNV